MTHAIALEAGQSRQGTFEPITPGNDAWHHQILIITSCIRFPGIV